ncbi:MAG: glycosyltransferase family 4 protein [Sporichthyaceae bacterium]
MADPRRLRIALVLGSSAGGVGRHVAALAAGLVGAGHDVLVVGPAATETAFGFVTAGATFRACEVSDRPRPGGDLVAVARLRGLLRGADVVHAHGLRAGGLAALALRTRRARPALVVTLHNALLAGGAVALAYRALERLVARGAAVVLAVSADLEKRMRGLGARRVGHAVVPAPRADRSMRDPAMTRSELGGDGPLVVTVGRLAEQKGLPLLLEAIGLLRGRSPAPLFVLAGEGPLEEMVRRRISDEDLPVRLLGRRDDVADLLAAADLVVVPSSWEGQPLVVQEALRAGAPLVATAVGGIPDLVGDAAVLVPYGDPAALADAIAKLLDDPAGRDWLAATARARAAELPGDADAVDAALAVYRQLC